MRPDFLIVREDTGKFLVFVELKTTIQLGPEAFREAMDSVFGKREGVKSYYNEGLDTGVQILHQIGLPENYDRKIEGYSMLSRT